MGTRSTGKLFAYPCLARFGCTPQESRTFGLSMMRRFARFRSLKRISREQAAASLAVAAVACLSSVIIHWSQATPVREPAWEHPLFGDLSNEAPSVASQTITTQPNSQGDAVGTNDHRPGRPTNHVRKPPLQADFTQNRPVGRPNASDHPFVTLVRFTEPEAAGSGLVRAGGYESRAVTEAAWLSGAIEEAAAEAAATPASPPSQIRLGEPVSTDD